MTNKEDGVHSFQLGDSKAEFAQSVSSMEASTSLEESGSKWTPYRTFATITDAINHILIAIVTVFLLYYSLKTYTITNVHVAFCTIGYVLLMSEAILVLAGGNALTDSLTRRAKGHVHWVLQVLGLICTVVGVGIMYRAKIGYMHFQTIHAITGIVSFAIMCFLALFGYPVFVAAKLRKLVRPVVVKFTHNFLGIACFVIGMVSQCYGYEKSWLAYVTGSMPHVELICTILTALITIFSLRGAVLSLRAQAVSLLK